MTADDCPFCRIAAGDLEAEIVFKDEELTAFWDHRPGAPVHILIIPNRHYASLNDVSDEDAGLLGRMVLKAKELAVAHQVDQSGYRIFMNTGFDGGQSVFHMHLHLMGGRHLGLYRPG